MVAVIGFGAPGVAGGKGELVGAVASGVGVGAGAGAGAGAGVGVCGGAGVEGGLGAAAASGLGLSLVTRKLNLAPEPFGSHSMKLYDGK